MASKTFGSILFAWSKKPTLCGAFPENHGLPVPYVVRISPSVFDNVPEETAAIERELLALVQECDRFYSPGQTPEQAPALLQRERHAVVLARS